MPGNQISLEPITLLNWRQALEVRCKPGQLKFVADSEPVALVILSKCYIRPGGFNWEPFALITDHKLVGVVALTYSQVRCEILHLLIDRNYQGRGIGKTAFATIVEHVYQTLPKCREITFTVHPDNHSARHIYTTYGARGTGETRDGEDAYRIDLRRD